MWQTNNGRFRRDSDTEFLTQIEAGFGGVGPVQTQAFGTSGPGVEEFVLDFEFLGNQRQLGNRGGLFKIDAIVNGNARLQLHDLHNRVAQIAPNPFHLVDRFLGRASGQ